MRLGASYGMIEDEASLESYLQNPDEWCDYDAEGELADTEICYTCTDELGRNALDWAVACASDPTLCEHLDPNPDFQQYWQNSE